MRKWVPASLLGASVVVCLLLLLGGGKTTSPQQPQERVAVEASPNRQTSPLGLLHATTFRLDVDTTPGMPVLATVPIDGVSYELNLWPHSIRSENYQLLVEVAPGVIERAEPGPERTLRGEVLGLPGSIVAGSLLEDGLHVRIRMADGETYWVQPVVGADLAGGNHVVYRAEDVRVRGPLCAVEQPYAAHGTGIGDGGGGGDGGDDDSDGGIAAGPRVAELAVDADVQYYNLHKGDPPCVCNVADDIDAVITMVSMQYDADVDITYVIATLIVRAAEPDPYRSTTAPNELTLDLRAEWEINQAHIPRDLVQLFSGQTLSGRGHGFANAVCNSFAYSTVQSDFDPNDSCKVWLSAHEMGHNWGAPHVACGPPDFTMCTAWTTCPVAFNAESKTRIMDFRDTRPCLD